MFTKVGPSARPTACEQKVKIKDIKSGRFDWWNLWSATNTRQNVKPKARILIREVSPTKVLQQEMNVSVAYTQLNTVDSAPLDSYITNLHQHYYVSHFVS